VALSCVYVDLDGTLLGRGSSLFRDAEGRFSLAQARALEACERAGVEVVIMSGRREPQVHEAARLMGQTSYIYEAGCAFAIDGETTLLTGEMVPDEEGTVYEKIEQRGIPKMLFEHFEGRSGGGYLDGRGELPLRFDAHQRLYFSVDFFDMRFPYPEDFRPVLQGHAELLGPFDDFLVTGDVEIQSARYTKTLRPEKAFVDFRKRLADVSARREPSGFRVRLDINVIADGTIKIKNNLADADVRGEFKVVGDAARVIVLGAFDVDTGTVVYQGNKYELKRLSVEFQDPRRNNPRLDARAETTKGNVTVTVSVTGTLEKYEVDLTSDPPLSKNDIVSLLSLGVTTQSLAGSEGAVGAGVASSLVLGPYKGRFEEGVRGIVKLDKFAIEPSFSPSTKAFEPKFIVGKSFGEQFSVSVSTSVGTSADSSATAEYKLLENVYLSGGWESATTTTAGDLGADIKIRYRYREFKDLLRGRD
jgi:autotransporter translocation and assembly factor TamB